MRNGLLATDILTLDEEEPFARSDSTFLYRARKARAVIEEGQARAFLQSAESIPKAVAEEANMRKRLLLILLIGLVSYIPGVAGLTTGAADISGTWIFSVDLDEGGHGDPTFVFKQEGENLTGTYTGPVGEHKVTGTVKGETAVFGFEFSREGQTIKATYTGTIETPNRMKGTVEFSPGPKGKWTAEKKGG
jgi:hypothetical protein